MYDNSLLDPNINKFIVKCFINTRNSDTSQVFVIYSDGVRETIWTFDPNRYDFSRDEFIGKTKIEAVFYCDRKSPRSLHSIL